MEEKRMSLLKISTCVLCLGTVLGVSSMAMEQNGEKSQQNVSKQVQILETNIKKEEKSENYLKFYNYLITKSKLKETQARKQAKIFEEKLTEGKSFIYAQYYSMLRVVRRLDIERAMLQSEVFEKEFKMNNNFKKADYCATVTVLHNLKAMRMEYLEREIKASRIINKDDKLIKKALKIAKKEIESGRSCFYVRRYVDMIIDGMGETRARKMADIVDKKVKEGKHYQYASAYSMLKSSKIPEGEMKKGLEVIDKAEISGKGCNYIVRYAELVTGGIPEDYARRNAELVEEEIGDSMSDYFYGTKFADLVVDGTSKPEARRLAKMMVSDKLKGKSEEYIMAYSDVIARGFGERIAREEAEIVDELMKEGKGYNYASIYADAVVLFKHSKEDAEQLANAALKEARARIKAEIYHQDKKQKDIALNK